MRVTLNGLVVSDDDVFFYRFFGFGCFCPKDIRTAVARNPQGEDLVLEVNSPGGSVFAGFEMYSALRAAPVRSVAEVQSLSASAASTMMLGCRQVMASPVAQVMIHLPSTVTDGDVNAHRQSIALLESINISILNAYELRCRGRTDRQRLEEMVAEETWMPAQEALAAGLVDGILYQEGEAPLLLPTDITNAVGSGIRALATATGAYPAASELRERYQRLVDEGKAGSIQTDGVPPADLPPVSLKDDWRNTARLSICNRKFL